MELVVGQKTPEIRMLRSTVWKQVTERKLNSAPSFHKAVENLYQQQNASFQLEPEHEVNTERVDKLRDVLRTMCSRVHKRTSWKIN